MWRKGEYVGLLPFFSIKNINRKEDIIQFGIRFNKIYLLSKMPSKL